MPLYVLGTVWLAMVIPAYTFVGMVGTCMISIFTWMWVRELSIDK